jgi:hypothetical protein
MRSAPSTAWKEVVQPGEEAQLEALSREFVSMQARMDARFGKGRALHRKQVVGAVARFEVLGGLPRWAAQGVFERPGSYDATVRLSNGGAATASDRKPDVRGFAVRVDGVSGPGALGKPSTAQVFSTIHLKAFGFSNGIDFSNFVLNAVKGPVAMFAWLTRRFGLLGGPRFLGRMLKDFKVPFTSYATSSYQSTVPVANGAYAVRYRFVPAKGNGGDGPAGCADFGAEFSDRLRSGPLAWDLQLQPFTSEDETPIEDATNEWPSGFTTVARLTLPKQDLGSAGGKALQERVERDVFDPWVALAAHRPLGSVQRARKVIYFASEKQRGAV